MNEKFNENAKVEKLTKKVGRGVRLIVIGPLTAELVIVSHLYVYEFCCNTYKIIPDAILPLPRK